MKSTREKMSETIIWMTIVIPTEQARTLIRTGRGQLRNRSDLRQRGIDEQLPWRGIVNLPRI